LLIAISSVRSRFGLWNMRIATMKKFSTAAQLASSLAVQIACRGRRISAAAKRARFYGRGLSARPNDGAPIASGG
jgi:hypothetical protein